MGDGGGVQPGGQAAVADAKRVVKGRVHFDRGVGALVHYAVELICVELRDECSPGRVLDAVDGPEGRGVPLIWVGGVDDFGRRREWLGLGRGWGLGLGGWWWIGGGAVGAGRG